MRIKDTKWLQWDENKAGRIMRIQVHLWMDFQKYPATTDPSGPRCPSPLQGRTPWAQLRQPRSSRTRSPHQGWARRPCRAWPCAVAARENANFCGTQPIKDLELHDLNDLTSQNQAKIVELTRLTWPINFGWLFPKAKTKTRFLDKSHTVQIRPSASCGCTKVPPAR